MTVNVKPFPQTLLVKIYTHSWPGQDVVPTVTRGSVGKGGGDEAWVPRTTQPGCPEPGSLGAPFRLEVAFLTTDFTCVPQFPLP